MSKHQRKQKAAPVAAAVAPTPAAPTAAAPAAAAPAGAVPVAAAAATAAAATAAAASNKLRRLLQQQKQGQKPQHSNASATTAGAATAASSGSKQTATPQPQQQSGKKRKADSADAPAKPASAAAAMASQLEAHSRHTQQQKKQKIAAAAAAARPAPAPVAPAPSSGAVGPPRKLSALQQKMASKLAGARFRWLNEKLYTCSGEEAWEYFQQHPEEFDEYHRGFGVQVLDWPANPLDYFIDYLKQRPNLVAGDFGCGEARLSASVPNKVHSFDLVAANERVTACNISRVPLPNASLDVAIFCLSLMGVDFIKFIHEAHRTLKQGGSLLISEVRSRFEEAGIDVFIRAVKDVGFTLRRKDMRNAMFATLEFVKSNKGAAAAEEDEEAEEGQQRAGKQQQQRKKAGGATTAPNQKQSSGHDRNKAKGKGKQDGGSQKKGGAKASTQFSHPVAKKGQEASAAPMLTACIYKKR